MSPSLCQLQINHDQSQFSFALRAADRCRRIQGSLVIDLQNGSQLSTAMSLTEVPRHWDGLTFLATVSQILSRSLFFIPTSASRVLTEPPPTPELNRGWHVWGGSLLDPAPPLHVQMAFVAIPK